MGIRIHDKARLLPAVPVYYPLMDLALRPIASVLQAQLTPFSLAADLIHNVRIGREGLSLACLREARARDIPFLLTPVHHPRWRGWLYRVYSRIYRQADAVIALTGAERNILAALGVDEKRIYVTGFGPILAERAQPKAFASLFEIDGPMVLFLGQHYRYKGYREVLRAAPQVWREFPDAKFVFIGRAVGRSEDDFRHIEDGRILRLGEVDLQTKTDALAACTVLCVPSTQESFGGVYTEAWSFGKPVIGCGIPAVSEVIADTVDGLLVPQESGAVADAICQVLRSPSAAAMGEAGRAKVQARFTWERLAALTEQAYFDTTGASPTGSTLSRQP
jgi:glycosyltransferase involved in cell wall biosynthesis